MNAQNNTYYGETSTNKKNSMTQNIGTNLRGEVIDPDIYYNQYNENMNLKKALQQMKFKNKKLSAKNQYLEIENKKLNIRLNKDPNHRKEQNLKQEINKDNQTLKIENENLKNKNKKLNETVLSMQKKLGKITPNKLNAKSKLHQRSKYPNVYQINDYEELIRHLQVSLKAAHEDRRNLIDEITSMKEGGVSQVKKEFADNIRDKNLKLSEMSLELDKLKSQFEINQKILNLTKQGLDEYKEKYEIERNKNNQLENELQLQRNDLDKLEEYTTMIENYKKKVQTMEDQISDLCESPFIKQINERDKNFIKLRETQTALTEAQRRLEIENNNMNELKRKYNELTENYNRVKQERDQFREDGMRYKIDKEEREKQGKEFDTVFNRISQFGEVDSNYEKMVGMIRGQLTKDTKGKNWENIDFLEKMDKFPDSKEELVKEINRLIIEKGVLGEELEKTQIILARQLELNEDLKKKQESEKKLYMNQIKSLRKLAQLVDRRNIPADFDLKVLYGKDSTIKKEKEKEKEIEKVPDNIDMKDFDNRDLINRSVYTSITGFSKDSNEEEITIDENYLDLYITVANFDQEGIQNKLGIEVDNLMSFISVDFYLHETQTSNLMSGQKPNYNFQLSFKVIEDENFILYLQDEYIIIELYYLKNNTQTIFATGKIKLSQLIQIENDPKTRVVHGYIEMFYIDDSSVKLCDIKYKMRMRKSILEKIKWINEKNLLFNRLDPVNEANMKIMGELNKYTLTNLNMDIYQKDDINNKVYNIRIRIIKGESLASSSQNPKIMPYLFYTFYKHNEHYSSTIPGFDPLFDDLEEFTCVYNKNFHNYLDKETLDIYVFDSSTPIEVDTDGKEVEMVRQNIENDLIGVCKIKLRGLILNNKIEGKFPVLKEEDKGNTDINRGYLIVSISAEEIFLEENEKKYRNDLDQKLVEGIDPILVKLASILRNKGLKMNTAFNRFDRDQEDQISLPNFRIVAYDFNFEQKEVERLVQVVFGNKVVLDRQDFYQVFNNLLPFEDDSDNVQKTKVLGEQSQTSFNIIGKQNNNMKTTGALKEVEINESNSGIMTNYNNFNNQINLNSQNLSNYNNNIGRRKSRTMDEIMLKVDGYMFRFGKNTASDLFKIFDVDVNLKVGKKELADGFAHIGIALNPEEHDMIWKSIIGKSDKTSFGYEEFKAFYDKHKVRK